MDTERRATIHDELKVEEDLVEQARLDREAAKEEERLR